MGCSLHSVLLPPTERRGLAARTTERTVSSADAGNARTSWPTRTSLLLAVTDSTGRIGLGEAAPLPGFSRESIERARADLACLVARFEETEITSLCASVQFALDTALLDLQGQREGRPVWSLLRSDPAPAALMCNGLVTGGPSVWPDEVGALLSRGVRCVKLKIAFPHLELDAHIEALRALAASLPRDITLRLDANRGFSGAEARALRTAFDDPRFEYLEDPVPLAELHTLQGAGLSWAADELLLEAPERIAELGPRDGLGTLIVKPTMLGSIARLLATVKAAKGRGIDTVFTHSFEGPVAYAATAHLAFATAGAKPPAMGLAAHDVLRQWDSVGPLHTLVRPDQPGLGIEAALREALRHA